MLHLHTITRCFLMGLALLGLSVSSANAAVYHVDRFVGTNLISGYIETDGATGVLGAHNIIDWAFDIRVPYGIWEGSLAVSTTLDSCDQPGGPTGAYSCGIGASTGDLIVRGTALTATPQQLLWDFTEVSPDPLDPFYLYIGGPVNNQPGSLTWCLSNPYAGNFGLCDGSPGEGLINSPGGLLLGLDAYVAEVVPIAQAISPVPIPAAGWLFGTALIGLVGFSKRKKAA